MCAAISAREDIKIGDKIKLGIDMDKCHFFDVESKLCITNPLNEGKMK